MQNLLNHPPFLHRLYFVLLQLRPRTNTKQVHRRRPRLLRHLPCRTRDQAQRTNNWWNRETGMQQSDRQHPIFQTPEITTGAKGEFRIHAPGEYENSTCDVNLMKSPRQDCNERAESLSKSRVVLTTNNAAKEGVTSIIPCANNLGFKRKEALPECKQALPELKKEAAP
ncbi:hypothetical protein V6N13_087898 [Hibiscus sabdariffa]|uniref:Uncharacterized protein n=1 Tax=Hibiscus sabdariffa TaxID=183260 RepID=A0ABR2FXM5_9ROSI